MTYTPHTDADIAAMLDAIGIPDIESLFKDIPKALRAQSFDLPAGVSEHTVRSEFKRIASMNGAPLVTFTGGGVYDHFVPAVVDAIASRSEFYTPYTPYQPEASQGTLTALFEYQTSISRLYGMDAANASLYDGGTALAEGALMALRITGDRKTIIIDGSVNPFHRQIVATTLASLAVNIVVLPPSQYGLDREALRNAMNADTAAVILQNPNFFGTVDDYTDIGNIVHERGALLVLSASPIALGMVKTPGEMDTDIAVGEGQSLGNHLSFGGPYLGIFTCKKTHIRNMPGRVAGETTDRAGRRGFVLTLQAREQHIKRHRATSNICSNQNLVALRALLYMTVMGKEGMAEAAKLNHDKAEYAKASLRKSGFGSPEKPTFNEFVVHLKKDASALVGALMKKGIAAGIPLGMFYPDMKNDVLVAVTEKRSKEEIDDFVSAVRGAV
ncbi:MAG: aminomethyl-transferring glycine dehydrogenase subunit GcvPA [Spirochaetota bacterium]|mgnify:CR=1 FL=1